MYRQLQQAAFGSPTPFDPATQEMDHEALLRPGILPAATKAKGPIKEDRSRVSAAPAGSPG